MKSITTNQMIYLCLIRSGYTKQNAMMQATGRVKSTVHRVVTLLAQRGYVTQRPGKTGTLQLSPVGEKAVRNVALIWQNGKPAIGRVKLY